MDDIIDAFRRAVFENYATFSGRAARGEFWWFVLAVILLNLMAGLADAFVLEPVFGLPAAAGVLASAIGLALILPELALGARRLHDTGRSGWWLLLLLLPVIGALALIWLFALPGGPEGNRYGPAPHWDRRPRAAA